MEKEEKITLTKILISSILFGISFIYALGNSRLVVAVIGYLIISYEVVENAFKKLFQGNVFNEEILMVVASIGAFVIGEYHEGLAVMLFYELGEFLQDLATEKSKKSISGLKKLRPTFANVVINDKVVKANPIEVPPKSIIKVEAGEMIPLDGIIVKGKSSINTSALTGESLPVEVKKGEHVFSGSINIDGTLFIQVESIYEESKIAQIIRLVENTEKISAKSEKFISKFAKIYTPTVVFLAIALAVIPSLFTGAWHTWIYRALMFLVISCPCALVISIPLTFFAGIGGASKQGILIKNSITLETLAKTQVVAFDKTGTLSTGDFEIVKINPTNTTEEELLFLAAVAENNSHHPIAEAIKKKNKIKLLDKIASTQNFAGLGIKTTLENGDEIFAGSANLMRKFKIKFEELQSLSTVIYVSYNHKFMGTLEIDDKLKANSQTAIENLHKLKVDEIVVLSGDKFEVVKNVANQLSIDKFSAELLPDEKLNEVSLLQRNSNVCFVGDGINDAPVIKAADTGIAMGKLGSDVTIEVADVVLMDDNPEKIADSIKLAKKTNRLVKENIVFTISFKVLMLILGALGIAPMWLAVFADVGVSLLAILNALRAFKK
ncbi:MAG: heavy metal translocating P-type ATPase [Clostridia bacterium]|nr:heavy metal translocating P-type ATPase [Clostridia bacterium]